MLAMVSTQVKELVPILAAHIYTVCPTAIPMLPKVTKNESEMELMESLGMAKGKDGEYETFDRFLARTEVSVFLCGALAWKLAPHIHSHIFCFVLSIKFRVS